VVNQEQWIGGLAMGYMWSRIVCSVNTDGNDNVSEISRISPFAEILASFSTVSQEKRHEAMPSWYSL